MSTLTRNRLLALLVFLMGIAYVVVGWQIEKNEHLSTTTVYGKKALGTSVFLDLVNKLGGKATDIQTSFLEKIPESMKAIAILGPGAGFTQREANLFRLFVEEGGTLVLSGHTLPQAMEIERILSTLLISVSFSEDPKFKNRELSIVSPASDKDFFKKGETYAFYGLARFDNCKEGELSCFYRSFTVGKGRVYVFASLPPFSNRLLKEKDNAQFAIRMAKAIPVIAFDEFHHFFSDRTLWDMMMRPAFGITMAGIVLILVLFFMFAHTPLHEKHLIPPPRKRPESFHDFNERFIQTALKRPGNYRENLTTYYDFLRRLFPENQGEITTHERGEFFKNSRASLTEPEFLSEATKILELHHTLLKRKGRITT